MQDMEERRRRRQMTNSHRDPWRSGRLPIPGLAVLALVSFAGCHHCQVTPEALDVDPGGNVVFEPGETVDVVPSWHYSDYGGGGCAINNPCPKTAVESLAAGSFAGPAGAIYTIVDPL